MLPGGYSQKNWENWVGLCGPIPKTLTLFMTRFSIFPTLFMTKICDFPYPIYALFRT